MKELMKNWKAFEGYNQCQPCWVSAVIYFVTIPFFVRKYIKCQHKTMIGTVDSYITLWNILR